MKKIILIVFMLLIIPACVQAKSSLGSNISDIENLLFGYDYSNESDTVRVERIEKYLYGAKKNGNIPSRIKDIQTDIGYTAPVKAPVAQVPETSGIGSNALNNSNLPSSELYGQKEDSSVDYPIVDSMELQVFNTTYKNESIYKRLDRLEQQVLNRKTTDSLNDRVDRLSMAVGSGAKKRNSMSSYSADELNEYYNNSGLESVNDQTIPFQLAVLEQDLLKGNFDNDNISNRLSRLENKIFKRTFVTDSDISRLQRIMVAYDAKKNSYKYENNRKMQNIATMSQLGGILLMILAILL